jgi:hypothetical protein
MDGYLRTLRSLAGADELLEPRAGYALRSFFTVFVPWPPLALAAYAIAALAALVAAGHLWRSDARFEVRASAIVLAFVLITPHVFEYDLLVLTPVFFLLANAEAASVAPARSPVRPWALAALFLAPLLTAIPAVIRLQFAVTPMVVLLWQGLAGASNSDAWTAWRQPAPAVRHPS